MKNILSFWDKYNLHIDITIISLAILLTNRGIWLCLSNFDDSLSFCNYDNIGNELILYAIASGIAILGIVQNKDINRWINMWKGNRIVIFFIGYAFMSVFWSVFPLASLYQVLILIFTSFLASYFGFKFNIKQFSLILFWFVALVTIASVELRFIYPSAAIMGEPHTGSWRGVFWHKNFTGSIFAFGNSIFLFYGITNVKNNRNFLFLNTVLYIFSLAYILFSKSAAGIVIWLTLNALVMLLFLWKKNINKLNRKHYFLLGGILVILGILIFLSAGNILGLLNRESGLTGRVPLWEFLIDNWVKRQPWLGYGHDALWYMNSFKNAVTTSQGWPFTITNSHNGFIDILLGLGTIGLVLVVGILLLAAYKALRFFIITDGNESILPLFIIIYFILANITISFYLLLESFHWLLLITVLFISTPKQLNNNEGINGT